MTIKHIVLCGGGEIGFIIQGAMTKLYENKIWNHHDIESVYATSIGSLIALGIVLKIDIETVNKYILERPLDFLQLEPNMIFGLIDKKGFFDKSVLTKFCSPLLKAQNLDIDITMQELYNFSNIEFNIFVTELNNFKCLQISYKSHPELKVLDAISMTCALPTIFKPICIDDKYYFDGGLFNNFPLNDCLSQKNCDINEVLAFRKISNKNNSDIEINNFFDYINTILGKMIKYCSSNNNYDSTGNYIYNIAAPQVSIESIIKLMDKENRKLLFDKGINLINDMSENTVDISENTVDISNNLIV